MADRPKRWDRMTPEEQYITAAQDAMDECAAQGIPFGLTDPVIVGKVARIVAAAVRAGEV